jgi:hypothetical protein
MLKCPGGLVYIGQMKYMLNLKIAEHKTAICTKNIDYAITRHYVNAIHSSASTVKFWGIEKVLLCSRGGNTLSKGYRGVTTNACYHVCYNWASFTKFTNFVFFLFSAASDSVTTVTKL